MPEIYGISDKFMLIIDKASVILPELEMLM